jgi:hypothetical protein
VSYYQKLIVIAFYQSDKSYNPSKMNLNYIEKSISNADYIKSKIPKKKKKLA